MKKEECFYKIVFYVNEIDEPNAMELKVIADRDKAMQVAFRLANSMKCYFEIYYVRDAKEGE